jgi:NADH:ubiquinone oxidoreductase subunit 6 (subunit J)
LWYEEIVYSIFPVRVCRPDRDEEIMMIEAPLVLQIGAMAALLLFLSFAVVVKDLMHSVLLLAAGSVTLGGLFFLHASPYAGAVEISVGAGLITALLATAISLTRGDEDAAGR